MSKSAALGPRDHFHLWVWRRPIPIHNNGSVTWVCSACGHATTREVGTIPAPDAE
jgi:hypothetical protein